MSDEDNDILEEDDAVEIEDAESETESSAVVDDAPFNYDTTGREQIRQQLQSDVEAFLAKGGRINEIEPNVVADPPRKPQSNYGGQPI